ncbi:hypothetical protein [Desertibaculum subflavum]|uniref:hypothetical protein n=1 Tax=Desertibaculum subflavum TaxID=2268458 RepID=UPI000E6750A4
MRVIIVAVLTLSCLVSGWFPAAAQECPSRPSADLTGRPSYDRFKSEIEKAAVVGEVVSAAGELGLDLGILDKRKDVFVVPLPDDVRARNPTYTGIETVRLRRVFCPKGFGDGGVQVLFLFDDQERILDRWERSTGVAP